MLVRHRDDFPKSGSHDVVLEKIRDNMLKKGVQYSLAEIRSRRQCLQKQHRIRKRDGNDSHPLHVPCTVVFDGGNKSLLQGTSYDPGEEEEDGDKENDLSSEVLKFSKG